MPPSPPEPAGRPAADDRLDELEIKLSFVEDLLDTLNTLVARQSEQIEVLGRELLRLKDRVDRSDRGPAGREPGADDERPPHY